MKRDKKSWAWSWQYQRIAHGVYYGYGTCANRRCQIDLRSLENQRTTPYTTVQINKGWNKLYLPVDIRYSHLNASGKPEVSNYGVFIFM